MGSTKSTGFAKHPLLRRLLRITSFEHHSCVRSTAGHTESLRRRGQSQTNPRAYARSLSPRCRCNRTGSHRRGVHEWLSVDLVNRDIGRVVVLLHSIHIGCAVILSMSHDGRAQSMQQAVNMVGRVEVGDTTENLATTSLTPLGVSGQCASTSGAWGLLELGTMHNACPGTLMSACWHSTNQHPQRILHVCARG
jgi:hypothetical protein